MPKTTKSTPTLRYAPYVPLKYVKVNSQLNQEDGPEDAVLRETVTRLGGTMVGLEHGVDYFVAHKPGPSFSLSEACEEFIGRHTNHYDQLIPVSDMFVTLNDMLGKSLPSEDESVHKITYNNIVFPIRAWKYTELGCAMTNPYHGVELKHVSSGCKLDIVAITYKKRRRDIWETTLLRYQILSATGNTVFVVSCMEVGLHDAVHFFDALEHSYVWSSRTFPTLQDAEDYLIADHVEPRKKQPNDFMYVVLQSSARGATSLRKEFC